MKTLTVKQALEGLIKANHKIHGKECWTTTELWEYFCLEKEGKKMLREAITPKHPHQLDKIKEVFNDEFLTRNRLNQRIVAWGTRLKAGAIPASSHQYLNFLGFKKVDNTEFWYQP